VSYVLQHLRQVEQQREFDHATAEAARWLLIFRYCYRSCQRLWLGGAHE